MTKEEIQTRLESAEKQNLGLLDEIKNLKAKLAEIQDEQEIPDKPDFEMDEKFYYLNSEISDVEDSCYDGDIDSIDFNMFHIEEYAKLFSDKCREIAMLLHCKWYVDREYIPNWDDVKESKNVVVYNNSQKKYSIDYWSSCEYGNVYFSTFEAAQKAADWMNAHSRQNL